MKDERLLEKCRKIKIVISDVDGVLTDGGMYYSSKGEELKKFNTRDGMAVELLRKNQVNVILMSKENSKIVLFRAKKIQAIKYYIGISKKEEKLSEICKEFSVTPEEIAYIGDDINDLAIMKKIGFSVSPNNGIKEIKKESDYVCELNGGEGVLREVADLIIFAKRQ